MKRVDIIGLEWDSNGPRIGLEWALDWTCILLSHPLLQVHTPKRLQILSLKKLSRNWTELTSLASNWPRVGNELDLYLAQSATAPGSPNRLQIYSLKKHSRNWTELATLASNWPRIGLALVINWTCIWPSQLQLQLPKKVCKSTGRQRFFFQEIRQKLHIDAF